jgi:N utilization substance protein B
VRTYALEIIKTINRRRVEIDEILTNALQDWQLNRLARIDRDILRIAVAEISFLGLPERVAINEAVELAKRYSDDEGHRFINGVLRRVTDRIRIEARLQ